MSSRKIFQFLQKSPRISPYNISDLPKSLPGKYNGFNRKKKGLGHKGQSQFRNYQPLGKLIGKTPFYLTVPREPYNQKINETRHYTRLSLLELQRLIDLKRINPNEPIDLTTLCNTGLLRINALIDRNFGIHLTEEVIKQIPFRLFQGADLFVTPVNIEIQYTSEPVIAAVEKAGGVITTRFYDLFSIYAKSDPIKFFKSGYPIPTAKTPPNDAIEYYIDSKNRGYLSDRTDLAEARLWLSQKYGYPCVDLSKSPMKNMLQLRKHHRQIFLNIEAGWLVNLADKTVLKPVH